MCLSVAIHFTAKKRSADMTSFPLKEETYHVIGLCMDVQKNLGYGFSEIVYKDAMEFEFVKNGLAYQREKELLINYKGQILRHKFFADFVLFENIIVEVKSSNDGIIEEHIAQTLNYLRACGLIVGLIFNFGKRRLEYKRLILN
jgi:GxxExxY protein